MSEGISEKTILGEGFKIDKRTEYSDMGQSSFVLTDYSKDDKLFLTGGYWTWYLKDKEGNLLYKGWWKSAKEFRSTLKNLNQ